MAKGKSTAKVEATETEATENTRVGVLHQAHADYIKEHKGIDVTPEQVFAVYSTRVAFRKSDEYQTGVRAAKAAEKEAAAKAREEQKAAREAEREQKRAEKEAAKQAKAEEKAKADAAKAAEAPADAKPAAKKAAAKKGGKGKAKAESPF